MTIKDFKYLSGIKPTGEITLGNYLGVIKPAIDINNKNNGKVLMFVADMHAYTTAEFSNNVNEHKKQLIGLFKISNLDFFVQSRIPEHNQLGWIMESTAKDWELRNQIQYKEKKGNDTRVSLLTYPALMAADCLMYDIPYILVGQDQLTHMYLTKDLAERFNKEWGVDGLVVPESSISDFAKIQDLRDPSKKMSKSNGDAGCIFLFEEPKKAYKKIIRAVTDSENLVKFDPENKPGVSNLIQIYSGLTNMSIEEIEKVYEGEEYPYGSFKKTLAGIVMRFLENIQSDYNKVNFELDMELEKRLKEKARSKMDEVFDYIGLK